MATFTAKKARAAMRTETAIREQLRMLKASLAENERTYHDERRQYWHEDAEDAARIGTLQKAEDGSIVVPLGFRGPKEDAFERVHWDIVRKLRIQIETLEWVLGKVDTI